MYTQNGSGISPKPSVRRYLRPAFESIHPRLRHRPSAVPFPKEIRSFTCRSALEIGLAPIKSLASAAFVGALSAFCVASPHRRPSNTKWLFRLPPPLRRDLELVSSRTNFHYIAVARKLSGNSMASLRHAHLRNRGQKHLRARSLESSPSK